MPLPSNHSYLPKVIYIMGTARSGSTLLEILLANAKGVFAAGELTSLIDEGFINDKICSCKQAVSKCTVWGEVKKNLNLDDAELHKWAQLQKNIDWHDGFFRQLFGIITKKNIRLYEKLNHNLLSTIQNSTDCKIIIDSSKYSGRALALCNATDIDLSVICLTRSPEGLVNSFQKPNINEQKPKSRLSILAYYFITLTSLRISSWLLKGKIIQIQYDSLITKPDETIDMIEKWSNLNLTSTKKYIKQSTPFEIKHIVTGNRLRKKGQLIFHVNDYKPHINGIMNHILVIIMKAWQRILGFQ